MNATKEGHKELLLSSGATIDLQKKFGTNWNEMASWLLEKGAAVNLVAE